jgi:hypothetical protein
MSFFRWAVMPAMAFGMRLHEPGIAGNGENGGLSLQVPDGYQKPIGLDPGMFVCFVDWAALCCCKPMQPDVYALIYALLNVDVCANGYCVDDCHLIDLLSYADSTALHYSFGI